MDRQRALVGGLIAACCVAVILAGVWWQARSQPVVTRHLDKQANVVCWVANGGIDCIPAQDLRIPTPAATVAP